MFEQFLALYDQIVDFSHLKISSDEQIFIFFVAFSQNFADAKNFSV